ncbi:putative fatty acyl-CoA reductase CG5065 [Chironomus tepperi]|uniref:putative fatty acyl-CoA reductase CG5065 n=1 Tax=Chironomus tepperi TaxID=113505 RepID=UPI00391F8601
MQVSKSQPQISIPEFYNGKSVFVTGGMGFIGKVLVEKLLRSCPGIENIYLLCRSKKGISINERLEEITSSPAFDLLREQNPQALNKIILIEGDVAMLELGISNEDQQILKDKVSIVMHSAATISFTEPLKVAVNTNLRSMRELIALAKGIKNLEAFIHISTAYTNWFKLDVKEEIYPNELNPHDVIHFCERFSDEIVNKANSVLLGKHTTTYTFTKNLAEKLLQMETGNMPTCIIRPSIVTASVSEPKPGWIDSFGAASAFMFQIGAGMFRSIQHVKEHPFDWIPVDKVTNLTIAAAWRTANDKKLNSNTKFPIVYHSTSGDVNPVTCKQAFSVPAVLGKTHPLKNVAWYPSMRFYSSSIGYDLDSYFFHYLPAYWMDIGAKLLGKKPRALKAQQFMYNNYQDLRFATSVPYIFSAKNYKNLQNTMTQNDQKTFNFDPVNINWKTYLDEYYLGMRKYLIKDTSDVNVMRKKVQKLKYTKYIMMTSLAAVTLLTAGAIGKRFVKKEDKESNIL